MDTELEQQLIEDYPILYTHCTVPKEERSSPAPNIALYGFECGDGWYQLIDTVSEIIESMVNEHPERQKVHAVQVKQKFGGLRVYTNPTPPIVYGITRLAQEMSRNMCEACGTYPVDPQEVDGWQWALCEECEPPKNY